MNTSIEVLVALPQDGQPERDAVEPAAFARDWFESVEERFSRFRGDSELAALNRSGGRPMLVSAAMLEVLQLAEFYRLRTGGLFAPQVLRALERAGYDRSFDELGPTAEPQAAEPPAAMPDTPAGAAAALVLDAAMRSVRLADGRPIDLGGIVKGWAADRLAAWYGGRFRCPRGLVNAGGDVRVWGGAQPGERWLVGVDEPRRDGVCAVRIALANGAAATSSTLGRRWRTASGGWAHHLIDPRTMRPAESDVVQCTVAGEGAGLTDCEVAAKTVLLLGSDAGLAWLRSEYPGLQAYLFMQDGSTRSEGPDWEVNQ